MKGEAMTDRELLERAAKAAGISIVSWLQDGYPLVEDERGKRYGWSPLVFDSDALRLAVKLRIGVQSHQGRGCRDHQVTQGSA